MTDGLCECGCGLETPIARCTYAARGWVKGEPVRFIQGHGRHGKGAGIWKNGRGATDGFCECGCGRKTSLAIMTSAQKGTVKGEPVRFIQGHQHRGKKPHNWKGGRNVIPNGYVTLNSGGEVRLEHRVIAEKALGKPLPPGVEVHHHGKQRAENRKNLVLCQDKDYHNLIHIRTAAYEACGNVNYRKCVYCKQYDDPSRMTTRGNRENKTHLHRECHNAYARERAEARRAACQ